MSLSPHPQNQSLQPGMAGMECFYSPGQGYLPTWELQSKAAPPDPVDWEHGREGSSPRENWNILISRENGCWADKINLFKVGRSPCLGVTCTAVHLSGFTLLHWVTGLYECPQISYANISWVFALHKVQHPSTQQTDSKHAPATSPCKTITRPELLHSINWILMSIMCQALPIGA